MNTVGVRRVRNYLRVRPVNLVPDAELEAHAMALANELADGPQVAMRLLKRSIYNAWELSQEQSFDEIAAKTAISDHHPDAREGVRAFREKRTPQFNRWLAERAAGEEQERRGDRHEDQEDAHGHGELHQGVAALVALAPSAHE
jgi:hypothetical protein